MCTCGNTNRGILCLFIYNRAGYLLLHKLSLVAAWGLLIAAASLVEQAL